MKSNDVRSHERGGHSTGPFLEITRSPNLPFNKSIVTRAVWIVAPSCGNVKLLVESLLMYVQVLHAFGRNLDPIMLPIPRLRTFPAFRYVLCLQCQIHFTVLKLLKPLTTTSLT